METVNPKSEVWLLEEGVPAPGGIVSCSQGWLTQVLSVSGPCITQPCTSALARSRKASTVGKSLELCPGSW